MGYLNHEKSEMNPKDSATPTEDSANLVPLPNATIANRAVRFSPHNLTPSNILSLQRAIGNRAVQRLLKLSPKLSKSTIQNSKLSKAASNRQIQRLILEGERTEGNLPIVTINEKHLLGCYKRDWSSNSKDEGNKSGTTLLLTAISERNLQDIADAFKGWWEDWEENDQDTKSGGTYTAEEIEWVYSYTPSKEDQAEFHIYPSNNNAGVTTLTPGEVTLLYNHLKNEHSLGNEKNHSVEMKTALKAAGNMGKNWLK
jgi:hypothetical protein